MLQTQLLLYGAEEAIETRKDSTDGASFVIQKRLLPASQLQLDSFGPRKWYIQCQLARTAYETDARYVSSDLFVSGRVNSLGRGGRGTSGLHVLEQATFVLGT